VTERECLAVLCGKYPLQQYCNGYLPENIHQADWCDGLHLCSHLTYSTPTWNKIPHADYISRSICDRPYFLDDIGQYENMMNANRKKLEKEQQEKRQS
jgi:hypothetical protein